MTTAADTPNGCSEFTLTENMGDQKATKGTDQRATKGKQSQQRASERPSSERPNPEGQTIENPSFLAKTKKNLGGEVYKCYVDIR